VINDERLLDKNEENITQLLGNYAIGNTEFSHMAHDLGNTYYLGNEHRPGNAEDKKTTTVGIKPLAKYQQTNMVMRTAFSTKKGQSWATGSDQARVKGIIAHKYLALVDSVKDLESVMEQVNMDRYLDQELKAEIKDLIQQVVQHPELEHYYDPLCEVMNERTILTTTGDSYIPDRIVVKDGIATIIDYKTGSQKQKDREQVDYYANLLTTMGYQIKEKVLIYTDQLFPVKWN
jgi:CRISPR/Cas system-associated exonuclease Cas4 (RecB family)